MVREVEEPIAMEDDENGDDLIGVNDKWPEKAYINTIRKCYWNPIKLWSFLDLD